MIDIKKVLTERKSFFSKNIDEGVYLFGAGGYADFCIEYLKRKNIKICGIIDSNEKLRGNKLEDIEIISYNDYMSKGEQKLILISANRYIEEIIEQYIENQNIVPFYAWYINRYWDDFQKLKFYDAKSYKVLSKVLEANYYGDMTAFWDIADEEEYFSIGPFKGNTMGGETFVDLGAYAGDTIEKFLNKNFDSYKHIYAFEPAEKNYVCLSSRMERLYAEWPIERESITIEKYAVGKENGSVPFSKPLSLRTSNIGMRVGEGGEQEETVEMVKLDDYFKDITVTFVKADIEGAERDMLEGAKKIIRRDCPKMAISVYHKPDDLLEIYKFLSELVPEYQFALRHHSSVCYETILYCWNRWK